MRSLVFTLLLFYSQIAFSQQNVRELKRQLNKLPSNTHIEIKSGKDLIKTRSKTVSPEMIKNERLEFNREEITTLKYDQSIITTNEVESKDIIATLEKFNVTIIDADNENIQPVIISNEENTESIIANPKFKIIPEFYIESYISNNNKIELIYKPIFTTLKSLKYTKVDDDYGYKSTLSFILYCENDNDGQKIKSPVLIEINSKSANLYPNSLSIDHLNLPSTNVEIFTKNATDSVDVKIITNNKPEGYIDHIKVIPILQLSTNRKTIQGFGIQQIPINISFKGSSSSKTESVSIITNKGNVNTQTFNLAYNSQKNILLRSEGLDDIEVFAISSSVNYNEIGDSNKIVFRQEFPWKFIVFAIIGGLIGGIIRFEKSTSKLFLKKVMISALMGLIGALTYFVLQVNLLEIEILSDYNEFGVLAYSALISILYPYNKKQTS